MDGTNASTAFVDSGPNALAVTAVGNAQISTTQSKFGGASGYFDGTGDYLSFTGGMPSGSGTAFTIECWIRLDAFSFYRSITRTAGGLDIVVRPDGSISCDQTSVTSIASSAAGVIIADTWYHVAVTRDTSNNYKLFINGTQMGSGTNSFSVTAATTIGYSAAGPTSYFKGYIDDLRITKYARYQSSFTPPAQAHPNIYNPYTTLPVSGAALWLDASQQDTIFTDAGTTPVTTSGQSVYQWNDLSGNNRHAVQATSGNRPTWLPPASGQNGLGAVKILGATSNQSLSATVPASIWNNPFSVFFVFVNTATNSNKDVFIQGSVATGGYRSVWISNASPSKVAWSQFASVLNMANTANLQAYAISLSSDAQNTSAINAITNSTSYSGTVSHISISSNTLYLGGLGTPADYTLCEMAIFPSQLTSGQLTSLNNYAKTKWETP
jgi:hypothetical protein